jgi:hypothetical protein
MIHTAVKSGNNGEFILMKDGGQSVCPFTQPFPVQGNSPNALQIMRVPCTTQCPHANLVAVFSADEDAIIPDTSLWVITCTGTEIKHLCSLEEIEPKNQTKLRSI